MAIKDCIPEIQRLAGDALTARDIEEIAREIDRRAQRNKANNKLLSDRDALDAAAESFKADQKAFVQLEQRNRAINLVARRKVDEFVSQAVAAGARPDQAITALNVGINRNIPGARASVAARRKAIHDQFLGGLVKDLERQGLLEFLTRRLGLFGDNAGVLDRDIARAMWSIDESGKVTVDADPQVKKIAEIIHVHQEDARQRTNRAGAFIQKMPGWIVRQSHDQGKIIKAGIDQWVAAVRPLLDADKTFGDKDPDAFLRATFYALSSGEHLKSRGGETDIPFKGPGNLAKQVSQDRLLHFKDADSWLTYNSRFGTKSLIEGIVGGLEHAAGNIAIMETWGTNPEAMFQDTIDRLAQAHRTNPDWSRKLRSEALVNQYREIDGTTRQVDNLTAAHISSGIRAVQSMAKLGGSTISSVTDLATAASELRWQGHSLGSAYAGIIGQAIGGRARGEARALSAEIGVGLEGISAAVVSRFSASDQAPGVMSNLMRLYFKLNLLTGWTDSVKTGAGRMMAWRAGQQAEQPWGRLDARFRNAISLYGIDDKRWDVIRKSQLRAEDARAYLTAQGVRDLPDEAFKSLGAETGRDAQRFRDELSTALQAFYSDRVDYAVVTPGAAEAAILNQGTKKGTWLGEGLRFITQFKAFPVAYANKVFGRDLGGLGLREGLLKGQGDLMGLAHTIAATTVLGMAAMEVKDILKGKAPRDPLGDHWKATWSAALLQGGGMGIYGDYLFGQYDRFGQTFQESILGPTASTINDLLKLKTEATDSQERKNLAADVLKFGLNNAPFLNLFYVRLGMDYAVLWNLQEMVSPGYLKRMERNLKNNSGQTYLIPPSSLAH